MRVKLIVAYLILAVVSDPAVASRDDAAQAYSRGDYPTALRELQRLANQGDFEAAAMVGMMYSQGIGVARNCEQGLHWTRKAIEKGLARAQHNLGRQFCRHF